MILGLILAAALAAPIPVTTQTPPAVPGYECADAGDHWQCSVLPPAPVTLPYRVPAPLVIPKSDFVPPRIARPEPLPTALGGRVGGTALAPAPKYSPQPCGGIVTRARLADVPFSPEAFGKLFTQALRDHGYEKPKTPPKTPPTTMQFGQSIVDMIGCLPARPVTK